VGGSGRKGARGGAKGGDRVTMGYRIASLCKTR